MELMPPCPVFEREPLQGESEEGHNGEEEGGGGGGGEEEDERGGTGVKLKKMRIYLHRKEK